MRQNYQEYFKYLLLEDNKREMTGEEFVEAMCRSDIKGMMDHFWVRKNLFQNYRKCRQLFEEIKSEDLAFISTRK
jgi:hypothetical protein